MNTVDFFLGANSAKGFASLFSELYDEASEDVVILKGGSGTGKSTLMKKIASAAEEKEENYVERIHCSSDPNSLDAVIFHGGKCCIVDGTAPHVVDPTWPGAIETLVNLGDCWNRDVLKSNKGKIVEIVKRKKKVYVQVYKLLKAAGDSEFQLWRTVKSALKREKVIALVEKISDMLPDNERIGKKSVRLLSGITPDGLVCYTETVSNLCDNIIVLEDGFGISEEILSGVGAAALKKGIDVIYCMNPLHPFDKIEHIIMPQIKFAVVTKTNNEEFAAPAVQNISLKNFVELSEMDIGKARQNFEKKAIRELINEACKKLNEARELHSLVEEIYVSSMDFSAINEKTKKVSEIFNLGIDK